MFHIYITAVTSEWKQKNYQHCRLQNKAYRSRTSTLFPGSSLSFASFTWRPRSSIILEMQGQRCGNILGFTKRRKSPQRRKIFRHDKSADLSDNNRWSIGWGNEIVSNDRIWNLNRLPSLELHSCSLVGLRTTGTCYWEGY